LKRALVRWAGAAALAAVVQGCALLPSPQPEPPPESSEPPPPADTQAPSPPSVAKAAPPVTHTPVPAPATHEAEAVLAWYERTRRLPPADQRREADRLRAAGGENPTDAVRVQLALLLSSPGGAVRDEARAAALLEPLARDASTAPAGLRALARMLNASLAERRRLEIELAGAQRKLDALRDIDKSLIERAEPRTGGR